MPSPRRASAPALLALLVAACAGEGTTRGAELAATDTLLVSGFSTPESVLHDTEADVYLVSNISGNPAEKDGDGFISRVTPAGEIDALRWIAGSSEGVELHAPKGMAIVEGRLYVADIDCLRVFDRETGAPLDAHCPEGALFLNDVAADGEGVVHVTDTQANTILRLSPEGTLGAIRTGEELGGPNGITFGALGPFVVTFGSGEIYQLLPDGTNQIVLPGAPDRQLDGVEFLPEGGFLFSSWGEGAVFYVDPLGLIFRTVEDVEAPADIGFDATRRRVLVPLFNAGEVLLQPVQTSATPASGG